VHHPVKDTIQKIFADRRPLFSIRRRDRAVNDAAKINIPVDLVGHPERAELLDLQLLDLDYFLKLYSRRMDFNSVSVREGLWQILFLPFKPVISFPPDASPILIA
jgi:hypothetical protein